MKILSKRNNTDELLQWILFASLPFRYFEIFVVLFLLVYIDFNRWKGTYYLVVVVLLLSCNLFVSILFYEYSIVKPIQQLFLIGTHWIAYPSFIAKCKGSYMSFWKKYLIFCEIAAYLGLIQLVCALSIHIDPLYFIGSGNEHVNSDVGLRLHSFFEEPGYLATFLVPYIIYSILNFKKINKIKFLCVFISCMCTFSAAAYVVLILFGLYKLLISKYRWVPLIVLPLFLILFVSAYLNVKKSTENNSASNSFQKVDQTIGAFSIMSPSEFEMFNASTYAIMTNLWVAIHAPNRLIGTGIGTHGQSYTNLYKSDYQLYGLNKDDAFSMGIRIFSEFGYIGVFITIFLIFRGYNKRNPINVAMLFYIMAIMIRGGHYTYNGVFLFLLIYYYTSRPESIVMRLLKKYIRHLSVYRYQSMRLKN